MKKIFTIIICKLFLLCYIGSVYADVGDIGHWRDSVGGQIPGTTFGGFDFDSEIRNDGIYTKPDDSTIEVSEAGDYLIIATTHDEDTSNGRYNSQLTISQTVGTGDIFSSNYTGFSRNNNENESWTRGVGIIIGATANSQFQVQKRRDTDTPIGGSVVDSSDLQIVKLNQSNYGIYDMGGTGNTYGGTTPNTVDITNISSESDTASIEGNTTSDTITIKGDNKTYLIAWSVSFDTGGSRTQRIGHLEYDDVDSLSTRSYCFGRNDANEYCGLGSMDIIRTSTADIDLQTEVYIGDGVLADEGGADVDGSLETDGNGQIIILEMPDSLEVFNSSDSVGLQDITSAQTLNIALDVEINDTASFTKSSDTEISVTDPSDIFSWANVWTARSDISSGTRLTSYGSIVIDGVEQTTGAHGNYSRGNQSTTDTFAMGFNPAGIFTTSGAGSTLGVNSDPLAGGGSGGGDRTQPGTLGFFVMNLDTLNSAPTDISLTNNTIEEGNSVGTLVGTLSSTDADTGDSHTYSFSCSTAGTDDSSFAISGSGLNSNEVFDFATKSSYDICIQTSDGNGGTFDENFTITIEEVPNVAPNDITLSNNTIEEGNSVGTLIGSLTTTDSNTGDSHTYSLSCSTAGTDDSSFAISGSDLNSNEVFDFATKSSYDICIRTDDGNGGTFDENFTITIDEASEIWDFESSSPTYTTDATYPWSRTTTNPYEGIYSIESGNAGVASSESCFEIDKTLENDSTISFYKEVSSESTYDYLYFYIDDTEQDSWSGIDSWSQETYDFSSGTYNFKWCYEKDTSVDSNDDTARIDYIEFYDQPLSISPGGSSSGLQLWLKSNVGTSTTTDGGAITSWADQSGNGLDANSGVSPTYEYNTTDNLNFYPLIDFDGTDYLENTDNGAYSHSYFAVIVPDNTVDGTLSGEVPFGLDCDSGVLSTGTCGLTFGGLTLGAFTAAINDEVISHALGSSTGRRAAQVGTASYQANKPMMININENESGTGSEISEKGEMHSNYDSNTYQTLSTADYRLGMSTDDANPFPYEGKIVEIINYNSRVGTSGKKQIESYLGIKYGITLYSGTQNYTASDGITNIWDVTNAGGYIYDIFGIGRDDISELGQVQSKSTNDNSIITIEADGEGSNLSPSFSDISDLEFLTISNNNLGNTWTATDAPSGYYNLSRGWKVQEVGDVGTITLDFNVDNTNYDIPDLLMGTSYYFIYDSDNDNTLDDETPQIMTNTSGSIWEISGTNLQDGREFTIATQASTNNLPTDISITNDNVNENITTGTSVGNFSTTDGDIGDSHTYSLVTGAGDDDNSSFSISGNTLSINESPDFEIQNTYNIRVQTDDGNGGQYQKEITININNLGETTDSIIDFEEADDENKYIVTSGTWTRNTVNPNEGSYSLESSNSGNSTQSCFQVNNTFTSAGSVSFDYYVSSASGSDYLYFYIDNVEEQSWSGDVAWATYVDNTLSAGSHSYKWCYVKDTTGSSGTDNAYIDYITFDSSVTDITKPVISGTNYTDSELLPGGNHDIIINYYDSDSGIDTSSDSIELYKWNGTDWGSDISSSGFSLGSKTISSTSATYPTNNLIYGKYRYDFQISDYSANSETTSIIFYIDEPSLLISSGSLDIGQITNGTTKFSTGELFITVETLGAGFDLILNKESPLLNGSIEIIDWNNIEGVGYELSPYSSTISIINTNEVIASETESINTDGNKNIYIYSIKLGSLIDEEQSAGNYNSSINFTLNVNY